MRWILNNINTYFCEPLVPAVLIVCGFYITARLRFLYVTKLRVILRVLTRRDRVKGISPFRALSVALAGTLGVGNILGVASAVVSGGAGAVFWMWAGALLSMTIKYCEVVLAVKYKKAGAPGGAMYYMSGKCIPAFFAILCVLASFALGNLMQMRAVAETLESATGISPLIIGVLFATIVFFTVSRGFTGISGLTVLLIPLTSLAYILISVYVIMENICLLPGVISRIFREAFSLKAAAGGFFGLSIMKAVRYGIARGLVTNEAGCGTAPMAHAEAETKSAVEQGFWGIFEVFADTLLLCTASAFVILISIDRFPGLSGMELVIASFSSSFGDAAGGIIGVFIIIFAFSTIVGWFHYGKSSLGYLTQSKKAGKLYIALYSLCCLAGAFAGDGAVWAFTDITVGLMTLVNMFFIMKRLPEIKRDTSLYFSNNALRRL